MINLSLVESCSFSTVLLFPPINILNIQKIWICKVDDFCHCGIDTLPISKPLESFTSVFKLN